MPNPLFESYADDPPLRKGIEHIYATYVVEPLDAINIAFLARLGQTKVLNQALAGLKKRVTLDEDEDTNKGRRLLDRKHAGRRGRKRTLPNKD